VDGSRLPPHGGLLLIGFGSGALGAHQVIRFRGNGFTSGSRNPRRAAASRRPGSVSTAHRRTSSSGSGCMRSTSGRSIHMRRALGWHLLISGSGPEEPQVRLVRGPHRGDGLVQLAGFRSRPSARDSARSAPVSRTFLSRHFPVRRAAAGWQRWHRGAGCVEFVAIGGGADGMIGAARRTWSWCPRRRQRRESSSADSSAGPSPGRHNSRVVAGRRRGASCTRSPLLITLFLAARRPHPACHARGHRAWWPTAWLEWQGVQE